MKYNNDKKSGDNESLYVGGIINKINIAHIESIAINNTPSNDIAVSYDVWLNNGYRIVNRKGEGWHIVLYSVNEFL